MRARFPTLLLAGLFALPALLAWAADGPAAGAPRPGNPAPAGSTSQGTQPPLSFLMFPPSNCGVCHGDYGSNEISPWNTWAGTMMAQATRDPLFWAALDVANNDALEDDDVPDDIGQFCLRCHTPVGWLEGRASNDLQGCGGESGLDGFIDAVGGDFDGVTCHTCHRMMVNDSPPMGEEPFYLENAQYWIDDTDCDGEGEPCRRGPYDYPADGVEPIHAWAYSPYHESSNICGTCHNVSNPAKNLLDANGDDTGLAFPVERTFREWSQSDFAPLGAAAQNCQGCHMPDASSDPAYACVFANNNHTGDMPIHQFAGGNTWIPEVLKGEYPDLGLGEAFDRTRALAFDMLQNRSAVVEITVDSEVDDGATLNAEVKVTNTSGHKLPTGYSEGRRMWINIQVHDANDQLLWESAAYDSGTGELTHDLQAKVYRVEHGIWDDVSEECEIVDSMGREVFHFVRSDCIRLDNRIPPLGFTGKDDPETQPVGYSYPETSPGSGVLVNYDTTGYAIPIPLGAEGPLTISAALYYQTASKEYIEFLLNEAVENDFPDDCTPRVGSAPGKSRGELMHELWETYDRSPPVEMGMAAGQSEVILPTDLDVTGTIDEPTTLRACQTVVLGPGLVLQPGAAVRVVAGTRVEMHPTVDVEAGATLDVEIDPNLCT